VNETDRAAIDRVVESLTTAWNSGEGTAFARSFTRDADFVNIYAMHSVGRDAIEKQHQTIFDGVYRGSQIAFTTRKARLLLDGVVLAHIDAQLRVPSGPMAGKMRTLATAVLVGDGSGRSTAPFRNTREQAPPELPTT